MPPEPKHLRQRVRVVVEMEARQAAMATGATVEMGAGEEVMVEAVVMAGAAKEAVVPVLGRGVSGVRAGAGATAAGEVGKPSLVTVAG